MVVTPDIFVNEGDDDKMDNDTANNANSTLAITNCLEKIAAREAQLDKLSKVWHAFGKTN